MTKKEKKLEEEMALEVALYTQSELDAVQATADAYLDDLQRERASFTNYKRRVDQDNALVADMELARSISLFLPVVDDLERALKNRPEDLECQAWTEGIEHILQKLLTTLAKIGVQQIDIKPGDDFDPTDQEALTHEENDTYHDGQVIDVVQTGYKLKDRIIRPACVRVAK